MNWFHRHATGEIPVVPDDRDEREYALNKSLKGYEQALEEIEPVLQLAGAISSHYEDNHYILRLKRAYGEPDVRT